MKNIEYRSKKYANWLKDILSDDTTVIQKIIDDDHNDPVVYIISDPDDDNNIVDVGYTDNFGSKMHGHHHPKSVSLAYNNRPKKGMRQYKVRYDTVKCDRVRFLLMNYITSILKPKYFRKKHS